MKYVQHFGPACAGLVLAVLSACNNSSSTPPVATSAASSQSFKQAVTLEGLVSNDQGPIRTGLVLAYDEQGRELAKTAINESGRYQLPIAANTHVPLILHYAADEKATAEQHMLVVVVHSSMLKYDINPRTTEIAKQAKSLGGYSHKNLVRAAEMTGIVPADNKTTAGFRGDPTTQYGGWH